MGLRFRPVDTTFYDLFAKSATHLVGGAALLAEMLGDAAVLDEAVVLSVTLTILTSPPSVPMSQ